MVRFIKICPRCASTDITIPPGGSDLLMSLPDYCSKCGLAGRFPEIDVEEIEKFKKEFVRN